MKFSLGIRSQLGAGIILTTLAGIGLIGLLSVKIVEMRSMDWKIYETENTVRFVRFIFSRMPVVQQTRLESVRKAALAAEALKNSGINDFRFIDALGKELLSEGRLSVAAPDEQIFSSQGIRIYRTGGGWFSPGDSFRVEASLDGLSARNGGVEFDVSLVDINKDLSWVKRFILAYALIDCVIIIAIGFYFLSKAIVNPIKKLDDAATRIASGALGERADVTIENEVGSLAASFNMMAGRVETEIKRLERVNLELVNAEEQLLRSRTLAAMGSLSAGIAHEIGNPLGALNGYLDILQKGALAGQDEKDIIRRMVVEAGRIDTIVREFLELARPSARAVTAVDVNALVKDAVKGLEMHRDFKAVKVKVISRDEALTVMIDEGKLRQVFVNLLLNAAQAVFGMGEAGEITVEAGLEKEVIDAARRRSTDTPLDRDAEDVFLREFVVISFADNGPGIKESDAAKIFDPFYTTKEVGKGTGLGLFVSQGIIKTYGGEITFKTGEGRGAVFAVRLPLATA